MVFLQAWAVVATVCAVWFARDAYVKLCVVRMLVEYMRDVKGIPWEELWEELEANMDKM